MGQADHIFDRLGAVAEWVVILEAEARPSTAAFEVGQLRRLLAAIGGHPVALHTTDRCAVQCRTEAASAAAALAAALARWDSAWSSLGLPQWEIVRTDVVSTSEFERELQAGPGSGVEDEAAGAGSEADARWRLLLHGSWETLRVLSADLRVLSSWRPGADLAPTDLAPTGMAPTGAGPPASLVELVHPDDLERVHAVLRRLATDPGSTATFEARLWSQGEWCWFESVAHNLLGEALVGGIVVNSRDISERQRLQEQVARGNDHDLLTGLASRSVLLDELEFALARSERSVAVIFADIDNFKGVVSELGAAAGERVLLAAAERLVDTAGDDALVARLGRDEFALFVEGLAGSAEVAEMAHRIVLDLARPVDLDSGQVSVTVSVGVAMGSASAQPATLLRHAELAMYRRRRGRFDVFGRRRRTSRDAT